MASVQSFSTRTFFYSHTWGCEGYSFHFNKQHAIIVIPVLARKFSLEPPVFQFMFKARAYLGLSMWGSWRECLSSGSLSSQVIKIVYLAPLSFTLDRFSPGCPLWVRDELSLRNSFANQGMVALRRGQKVPLKRESPKLPRKKLWPHCQSISLASFLWVVLLGQLSSSSLLLLR